MSDLGFFPEQASRFATTRDTHAQAVANTDRYVKDLGRRAAHTAVGELVAGDRPACLRIMRDCLTEQISVLKIHVPGDPS